MGLDQDGDARETVTLVSAECLCGVEGRPHLLSGLLSVLVLRDRTNQIESECAIRHKGNGPTEPGLRQQVDSPPLASLR